MTPVTDNLRHMPSDGVCWRSLDTPGLDDGVTLVEAVASAPRTLALQRATTSAVRHGGGRLTGS